MKDGPARTSTAMYTRKLARAKKAVASVDSGISCLNCGALYRAVGTSRARPQELAAPTSTVSGIIVIALAVSTSGALPNLPAPAGQLRQAD